MPQLTKRQWITLQQGLVALDNDLGKDAGCWDREKDGPPPTMAEMAELSKIVGDMPYEGYDDYKGPMKNGKPYITDVDKVVSALLLTDAGMKSGSINDHADFDELEKTVTSWTDDQRAEAFVWAACSHLAAGDNDDVEVPPTPPHVEAIRPKYGSAS